MLDNRFDVPFLEPSEDAGSWADRSHGEGRHRRQNQKDELEGQTTAPSFDSTLPSSPMLLETSFQSLPGAAPMHTPGFRPSSTRPPSTRPTRRLRPLAEPFLPSPTKPFSRGTEIITGPASTPSTSATTFRSKPHTKSSASPIAVNSVNAAKQKNNQTPKLAPGNPPKNRASDLDKQNDRALTEIIDTLQTMNRTLEDYIRSTRPSREERKSFAIKSFSSVPNSSAPAVLIDPNSPRQSHESLRHSSMSKMPSGFSPYDFKSGVGSMTQKAGTATSLPVSGEYSRVIHESSSDSVSLMQRLGHEQEDLQQRQHLRQQQMQHALVAVAPKISTTLLGFQVSHDFVSILRSAIDAISRLRELYEAQCQNGNAGCCMWMLDAVRAIAKTAADRLGLK